MSHVFVRTPDNTWGAHPLSSGDLDLHGLLAPAGRGTEASALHDCVAVRLLSLRAGTEERWVVVAGHNADLRVNGIPLVAIGMRVLADRDELSLPGVGAAYFSAEQLAEVVPFHGADRVVLCGRCRQEIVRGTPSVKCPQCGTAYHETPELNCFTYVRHCAFCPATTALDTGYSWVPED